jgi:hypothetical protein
MSLDIVPRDTFHYQILPSLPAFSLYALKCTTKGLHQLIVEHATYPQPDIDFWGTKRTITLSSANQNLSGLLHHRMRVDALILEPSLHSKRTEGGDVILGFGADILFDPEDKVDGKCLARHLNNGIWQHTDEFCLFVLSHPNAPSIEVDKLEANLLGAARPRVLRVLLTLPRAKNISAEHLFSCWTKTENIKNLKLFLSHPNFKDIPASSPNSLCDALHNYAAYGNDFCASRILRHPNIFKISSKDIIKLEQMLKAAHLITNVHDSIQTILDDIKVLKELKTLLEAPNPKKNLRKIGQTFILLSARTQRLLYKALCEVHGRRDDTVVRDGMFHLVTKPSSLLPILTNLLS